MKEDTLVDLMINYRGYANQGITWLTWWRLKMLDGGDSCLQGGVPTRHAAVLQVKDETGMDRAS